MTPRFFGKFTNHGSHSIDNEQVSESLNLDLNLHAFYEQQSNNGMTIPAVVAPTTLTKWVHVW